MSIGERIAQRRKELGMTLDDLAEKVDTTKTTLGRWENGFVEKQPAQFLIPLSRALKVSPNWLLGLEDIEEQNPEKLKMVSIPVYPLTSQVLTSEPIDFLYLPLTIIKGDCFASVSDDDSMSASSINKGDILIFERTKIKDGEIGCFVVDGEPPICRKYIIVDGKKVLRPMNFDYMPIVIEKQKTKCLGVLRNTLANY